ncbi:MAG TPA: bifunctional glutamate N-acetyltransferase/amino-acid acetyltransferase ArgJ [Ktedonobacterales bacterium]|nr:bifunctional glutamate N-acetyltransferase/amino-acid acetyltransferase ArgJ [Ktedonobacterales bacterium]
MSDAVTSGIPLPAGAHLVAGGVTAPRGFRAGATYCGIKTDATAHDFALLLAEVPCVTAATFTTSRTAAHPVQVCQEHLAATGHRAQAVVVNSSNANCSNGPQGLADARRTADLAGAKLGIDPQLVMVSSTGIIGRPLPMDRIEHGIAIVEVSPDGGEAFSGAIITTDTRTKLTAIEFELDGKTVRLGGTTKGAGMIYPNMATMLCYITTDAAVDPEFLRDTLRGCVADSFNMVCVDGDMSTNDTVLCLANGFAGNAPVRGGTPDGACFAAALDYVTQYLAREIARDGEGATRLMTVVVHGAASDADARRAARAVTASPLWQCAVAGGDANWGRILAALGASGADFEHERLEISINGLRLVADGHATAYDPAAAKQMMQETGIDVAVDLHAGACEATAWGCDLTHGYIDENTTYFR